MNGVVVVASFMQPPPAMDDLPAGDGPVPSTWESTGESADYLVLFQFSGLREASDDLRSWVDRPTTSKSELSLPNEVHHIEIEHRHGVVLSDVPVGDIMVLARAVSNPGFGSIAGQAMEEVLATFVQVSGYHGHIQGFNSALHEDYWALVFRTGTANLPLPYNQELNTRVYRRVR